MKKITWQEIYQDIATELINQKEVLLKEWDRKGFFSSTRKKWINKGVYCYFLVYWELSDRKDAIKEINLFLYKNT